MQYYNPFTHHVSCDKLTGEWNLVRNSDHMIIQRLEDKTSAEPEIFLKLIDAVNGYAPDIQLKLHSEITLVLNVDGALKVTLRAVRNDENLEPELEARLFWSNDKGRLEWYDGSSSNRPACKKCGSFELLVPHPHDNQHKLCADCLMELLRAMP